MKKVLKQITVHTLPNGYALNFDGNEFMYFNEVDLLAGFLARVGSGQTKEMEKGDILNALLDIMLGQKYAQDVTKLNDVVMRLEAKYSERLTKLEKEIKVIDEAIEKHATMKKQLELVTKMTKEMQEGYEDACKPYTEYKLRINDLEKDTGRMEEHFKTATTQATSLLTFIRETIDKLNQDERLLAARADMLAKIEYRNKEDESAAEAAEVPAVGVDIVEASNTKPKKEKPAKTKTNRTKRDEAILAKIKDNPNVK